jgi:SAM-dependent methyltransferase
MLAKQDIYAKGMVEAGDEHFDLTPELDLFQYRMIRPHLGRNILEVGAGPGRIARLVLQDEGLSYDRYIICEPSDHFFEQLKRRVDAGTNVALTQGVTSELAKQYPRGFDTIFSVHVLEHIEDDRQFVEDCLQMLAPGGKLIILVPALQFLYSELDRQIGHYRRYNKGMMRKLVSGLGCRITKMYYTNFLAVFASLIFFKFGKLDYQKSASSKARFILLERIYSRYFIPVIDLMERYLPMPIGLNLTIVIDARTTSG